MAHSFTRDNDQSRQRLAAVLRGLSDEDLQVMGPEGWTVSALLAHLACWDQRHLHLIRRWQAGGIDISPVDPHAINESIKPLCLLLESRKAIELCLASAAAIDAELETLTADFVDEVEASPNHFRFNRSLHRNDHLNEIEGMLGR